MPDCPTCKKPMDFDYNRVTSYETLQGDTSMENPFPSEIKIIMFQNFVCDTCGTRTSQAVQTALYKNPDIKELAPTR